MKGKTALNAALVCSASSAPEFANIISSMRWARETQVGMLGLSYSLVAEVDGE